MERLVDSILCFSTGILLILVLTGCMRISLGQGAKIEVKAERGSTQTVSIGDKRVNVPVNATLPLSAQ